MHSSEPITAETDYEENPVEVHVQDPSILYASIAPAASKDMSASANSPTQDAPLSFVGQEAEQIHGQAQVGYETLPCTANTLSAEAMPFYMQPNVGTRHSSARPMVRPPWRQSFGQWNQQTNARPRDYTMPTYGNQYHQPMAQPPLGAYVPYVPNEISHARQQNRPKNVASDAALWFSMGEDPLHGPMKLFCKKDSPDFSPPQGYSPVTGRPLALGLCIGRGSRNSSYSSGRPSIISNVSSDRQPRFLDRPWRQNVRNTSRFTPCAEHGIATTQQNHVYKDKRYVPCMNQSKYDSGNPKEHTYDKCPCQRCEERDRSIYIDGFTTFINDSTARTLVNHFRTHFGFLKDAWVISSSHAIVIM
ncbi:hypothetical protein F5B19DRAFT_177047 [Rostrohypoxylon terebratum]|nr:hypothetical protein F5B19DRAFT_177047 [Rostrohypoxylon terebratum]